MRYSGSRLLSERYRLEHVLAKGGMGEVWRGTDLLLDRTVAVKLIKTHDLLDLEETLAQFHTEAKTGALLTGHANIVSVLDFGRHADGARTEHYLVMEFVDGIHARQYISQLQPELDPESYYYIALYIAYESCKAIQYAHTRRVLHRDLKPLNLFLSHNGQVKVGDFGLSRVLKEFRGTSKLLSCAYAAPEQWDDGELTRQTDLYQFGCTLYQLFTGELPFPGDQQSQLKKDHKWTIPAAPHTLNPYISPPLSQAILTLMSKRPEDRGALWQLYDVLVEELHRRFTLHLDVAGEPDSVLYRVSSITEIGSEELRRGPAAMEYRDFSEALSEGLQLVLAGVTGVFIRCR
ncbi:serine/threonine-protein kinase [Paenibacillus gansuensis]|uniref:non-specific serine/threonine protein kinase n=1 Tax=Paenibacillus gansuensis TaxID=306542 RepID=A0ABW5PHG5_9BACL